MMEVIDMNHKNDCCFEDIKVGAILMKELVGNYLNIMLEH